MRKVLGAIAFVSLACATVAQDVQVNIDVQADRNPISPYVYGTNDFLKGGTATRWGGNRTTTYNWETGYSNAGSDYNHVSDNYFGASSIPANTVMNFVNEVESDGQYSLVNIQAAGFVAADNKGAVSEEETAPSERWDSIVFRKNAPFSLTPDKTDGRVYTDEYINYLIEKLGTTGNGGIDAYAVDNEPKLWHTTHSRMHPKEADYDEIVSKNIEVASIVKEFDPNAEVFGPQFYGWWPIIRSRLDWDGKNFWEYYLDELNKAEQEKGKRLLDVISIHWYPEVWVDGKRIVDLHSEYSVAELTTPEMIETRLQSPRALWDEDYDNKNDKVKETLLPFLINSINEFYPGTKLAFTEFKYGAETHFSGGLTIVDLLGIFGREGVYFASKWDPASSNYAKSAYQMYLNYDGNGSKFGETSVKASVNDNAILSSVASVDEFGKLHIIAINKTADSKNVSFNIDGDVYSNGEVYGFGKENSTIENYETEVKVNEGALVYDVPSYTAVHIVLFPVEKSKALQAQIIEGKPSVVKLTFNDKVSVDNAAALTDFTVTIANDTIKINSISAENNVLELTLDKAFVNADTIATVSYVGHSVTGKNSVMIENFTSLKITNELESAPAFLVESVVSNDGKSFVMEFSKPINFSTVSNSFISLTKDGGVFVLDSIRKIEKEEYKLQLFTNSRIHLFDTIVVKNSDNSIAAKDGTIVSYFQDSIIGQGANHSAHVDSVVIVDNFTIRAYFDKAIVTPDSDQVGFVLKQDGVAIDCGLFWSSDNLLLRVEKPMYGDYEYTFTYDDKAGLTTQYGGFLESVTNKIIENNLDNIKPYVNVPAKIEAENYSYGKGAFQLEDCSDEGGGKNIGYIGSDNRFGYNLEFAKDATYTFSLRYASTSSNGNVYIYVDGVKARDLYIPKTGSWTNWQEAAVAIPFTAGQHVVEVFVETSGFNFNWFEIKEGANPSSAEIISNFTLTDGTAIVLALNRKIADLEQFNNVEFTLDGQPLTTQNAEFYNGDSTKINFTVDDIIESGQKILATFPTMNNVTTEGGSLNRQTDMAVSNKSRVTNILSAQEQKVTVYPIPANVGENIVIDVDFGEVDYKLINVLGLVVLQGKAEGSQVINVEQSGVYTLIVTTEQNKESVKIIVK